MNNFLDSNVWLALLWERHVHSQRAGAWFREHVEEGFSYCRTVQISVLRLLTTASVMHDDVKTLAQAWSVWDNVTRHSKIRFIAEPENIEAQFRFRSQLTIVAPKMWSDLYLLAFASELDLRLVTLDRALAGRGNVLVL